MPAPRALARFAPAIDAAATARRITNVCVTRLRGYYTARYDAPNGLTYELEEATSTGIFSRLLAKIQATPTFSL